MENWRKLSQYYHQILLLIKFPAKCVKGRFWMSRLFWTISGHTMYMSTSKDTFFHVAAQIHQCQSVPIFMFQMANKSSSVPTLMEYFTHLTKLTLSKSSPPQDAVSLQSKDDTSSLWSGCHINYVSSKYWYKTANEMTRAWLDIVILNMFMKTPLKLIINSLGT